jgi:malate dehydrogenase (oxaloacetate-decarboxylating)(NADP+)
VDSKGLVADNRGDKLPEHKLYFSRPESDVPRLTTLLDVVEYVKPTGLLGLSTVGGSFTEDVVRKLAELNERPIIFALSNPVSKVRPRLVNHPLGGLVRGDFALTWSGVIQSECTFKQAVEWTDGRVLFASGSPFDPVEYKGKTYTPGQGNNVYVFPGNKQPPFFNASC